ncbi:glycerophosphodiester phosphodiesterase [Bradyrhizobium ontarionense]|uniref:Glycerophosphodiester phosphodiesterase n=1 Tax=Bradyrhizobium ontarionense TaxID=2898149 RepID=A0ABY3RDW4_9BRAD|nr:glycerophosphodiester phosphodiesterase family protein [Bradyrhizobium sp. A19]UFZ05619.1 glycerophosphodiester phosphodiesterase [Bradyrhizobium sp. A19]
MPTSRKLSGLLALAACGVGLIFVNNSNLFVAAVPRRPVLLAHRGLSQDFDRTNLTNETCTARRMRPPTHAYLENTIASMQTSFAAGADIVEFDVHPTTDGQFAVFHDWTLDCRTDGRGVTRERAMPELKALDIGYGYTADDSRTFPFRGKGVGLMPSLNEVLAAFPKQRFLINIKSNDPNEGHLLASALTNRPIGEIDRLMVYGGDAPIATFRAEMPAVRAMSRSSLRSCLVSYVVIGWSGRVPSACRGSLVFVPVNVAPWLWGWPGRFLGRMNAAGSAVFAIGPYHGGDFSSGLDSADDIRRLPSGYTGGILTQRDSDHRARRERPGG